MGGSMRLGAYPCVISNGTLAHKVYHKTKISERHRHRYEVNNEYRNLLSEHGLLFSGLSPDGALAEILEIPGHPYFVGCQFHPELKSRPMAPHPLFTGLVEAALKYGRSRQSGPAVIHNPITSGDK